MVEVVGSEEIA
jgi:nucleolar protein 58